MVKNFKERAKCISELFSSYEVDGKVATLSLPFLFLPFPPLRPISSYGSSSSQSSYSPCRPSSSH